MSYVMDLLGWLFIFGVIAFLFANAGNVLMFFVNFVEWLFDKLDVSKWGKK